MTTDAVPRVDWTMVSARLSGSSKVKACGRIIRTAGIPSA